MHALVHYTSIPPYVLNTIQLFTNIKFVLQKLILYDFLISWKNNLKKTNLLEK